MKWEKHHIHAIAIILDITYEEVIKRLIDAGDPRRLKQMYATWYLNKTVDKEHFQHLMARLERQQE